MSAMGFALPRLTPLQAILLLDGLEALPHQIVEEYGEEIESFYRDEPRADDDAQDDLVAGDAAATGVAPVARSEEDLPF